MQALESFLAREQEAGKVIFPPVAERFTAFKATGFNRVKVVILGQDPYHGEGQAHGLCFSVRPEVAVPPSLKNIYKELKRDMALPICQHGCLTSWAEQGVLLLNATLTVEQGKAGSHQGRGWEQFTDQVIARLDEHREGLVFLLWGSYAQKKGQFINREKHCVLTSSHPSPLSAYRGFLGCGHFSQANRYLQATSGEVIDWSLP